MKDGQTVKFSLNDRFGSSPIVVMDGASLPGQGQGQLTDEQAAEIAWLEMGRRISDAWQTPLQRPFVRDQGPAAQDQAAWVGQGQTPVVHGQQGSGQVLQDETPAEAAHSQMVRELCAAWKTSTRSKR
jgi:hypothetical protein